MELEYEKEFVAFIVSFPFSYRPSLPVWLLTKLWGKMAALPPRAVFGAMPGMWVPDVTQ